MQEWVSVLSDEDEEDDADETLADWAKLETMRSSHPMHFAKTLAEVNINGGMLHMEFGDTFKMTK